MRAGFNAASRPTEVLDALIGGRKIAPRRVTAEILEGLLGEAKKRMLALAD